MTKSATEKPSRMEKRAEALFIKLIVLIFLMIKGMFLWIFLNLGYNYSFEAYFWMYEKKIDNH